MLSDFPKVSVVFWKTTKRRNLVWIILEINDHNMWRMDCQNVQNDWIFSELSMEFPYLLILVLSVTDFFLLQLVHIQHSIISEIHLDLSKSFQRWFSKFQLYLLWMWWTKCTFTLRSTLMIFLYTIVHPIQGSWDIQCRGSLNEVVVWM